MGDNQNGHSDSRGLFYDSRERENERFDPRANGVRVAADARGRAKSSLVRNSTLISLM